MKNNNITNKIDIKTGAEENKKKDREVDKRNLTKEITIKMIKETEITITIKEEDTNQEITKIITMKEIIIKATTIRCKMKGIRKTPERDIELCVFYNYCVRIIFIILKKYLISNELIK